LAMAYAFFAAFGGIDKIRNQFEQFVLTNLAPSFAEQVLSYVASIQEHISPGTLGVFGFLGFLLTSVMMLDKIEGSFNSIWGALKKRPLVRRFTNFWTLLSIGPLLIALSLILSASALQWLRADSGDAAKVAIFLVTLFAPYLMTTLLFFSLFYILPNAGIHRRDAFTSAAVTALVFELAKQCYAIYATYSIQNSVYGSLAILPVFFLWVYLVWMITLLGFEYCCYLEARRMKWTYSDDEELPVDPLLLLDILEVMAQYQVDGKGAELKDLVRLLTVNRRIILRHLDFLKDQELIVEVETELRDCQSYHLAYGKESLNHVKMLEALEKLRFRPVGPITRSIAERQNRVLYDWSVKSSVARGGPLVKDGPASNIEN
jgi:membrane protein